MSRTIQPTTQSLGDAPIRRTNGRANVIDQNLAYQRQQRQYVLPPGNSSRMPSAEIAAYFGCKERFIYRAVDGAGHDKVIVTFTDGLQKEIMLISLQPVLVRLTVTDALVPLQYAIDNKLSFAKPTPPGEQNN